MNQDKFLGHSFAFITIFIWGTTYITTKLLFDVFSPEEIIFYRFLLAYLLLVVIYPKGLKLLPKKDEWIFVGLGFFGVTLYFLLENWALKFTYASNVSLYAATIPLFTAILAHYTTKDEKFSLNLLIGFILSIFGISFILYNGSVLKLNLLGDVLALIASLVFAIYNVLIKQLNPSYNQLFIVRRTFFYGVVTMIPFMFITNKSTFQWSQLSISVIANLLFLTLLASLLCYVLWNRAIGLIGSIRTSNYIYIMPLVTIITSMIFLEEKVTWLMVSGGMLIILGVYINESAKIKQILKRIEKRAS